MKQPPATPAERFPGARFWRPRFWIVWLLLATLRGLSYLPLPLLHAIGAIGGEVAYHLHFARRDIARRNLRACFPARSEAEIGALARAHFRALATAAIATGISWWASEARLARLTKVRNREVLERARERGESIVLLAPHFVGLEHSGIYLSLLSPTMTMYHRHRNPLLDAMIKHHRGRFGGAQYSSKAPIKPIIQSLRAGRLFYYLPDQDAGRKGVFVPFFGVPAATFPTLGRIARLGRAAVIPCTTRLLPRGRGFEIILGEPLADYPCGDDIADANAMNRAIETTIAHAPAQYFWSHRRFKTRPPGDPPFYRARRRRRR
ncbi:MAG: lysophospholipid acyltransferase family protein [bacterium]